MGSQLNKVGLHDCEYEILGPLAEGDMFDAIARNSFLSINTVTTHRGGKIYSINLKYPYHCISCALR